MPWGCDRMGIVRSAAGFVLIESLIVLVLCGIVVPVWAIQLHLISRLWRSLSADASEIRRLENMVQQRDWKDGVLTGPVSHTASGNVYVFALPQSRSLEVFLRDAPHQ